MGLMRCPAFLLLTGGGTLVLLCAGRAQLDPDSPWPKWAHDNQNSSIGAKSLSSGGMAKTVRWIFGDDQEEGELWIPASGGQSGETVEKGAVLARDNKLYVPTSHGRLFCLNASNGTHPWTYDTQQGQRAQTPAIVLPYGPAPPPGGMGPGGGGQTLYYVIFACGDTLYSVTPDGTLSWSLSVTGSTVWNSPAVTANGRMYVLLQQAGSASVAAVSRSGSLVWTYGLQVGDVLAPEASPALGSDGTTYVVADRVAGAGVAGGLYAITDLGASATLKWRFAADFDDQLDGWSRGKSSPAVKRLTVDQQEETVVFFATRDFDQFPPTGEMGTVWAVIDGGTSSVEWWRQSYRDQTTRISSVESSPVVDSQGRVFIGTRQNPLGSANPEQKGAFFRAGPTDATTFFESSAVVCKTDYDHTICNIDATACMAVDDSGGFLALFQTEESGHMSKIDLDGLSLWGDKLPVRRTDHICLAMGPDGAVYFGTRYDKNPQSGETHGFVYAVWGFDPD